MNSIEQQARGAAVMFNVTVVDIPCEPFRGVILRSGDRHYWLTMGQSKTRSTYCSTWLEVLLAIQGLIHV